MYFYLFTSVCVIFFLCGMPDFSFFNEIILEEIALVYPFPWSFLSNDISPPESAGDGPRSSTVAHHLRTFMICMYVLVSPSLFKWVYFSKPYGLLWPCLRREHIPKKKSHLKTINHWKIFPIEMYFSLRILKKVNFTTVKILFSHFPVFFDFSTETS